MTQVTQNNVTLTYNSEEVRLESETRVVKYNLNPSNTWTIEFQDKTRTQKQTGCYWNLGIMTRVSTEDMQKHLDKKQYQLGFFTK
jgi:hypothetical protein